MTEYIRRNIDRQLIVWKEDPMRKPLLLRGARQVGKSSAVRHFGKQFKYFAEVNFEKNKAVKTFFQERRQRCRQARHHRAALRLVVTKGMRKPHPASGRLSYHSTSLT